MTQLLTTEEKRALITAVRITLENRLTGSDSPVPEATETLRKTLGAFVTLRKKGNLRGCIGHMEGQGPLLREIQTLALSSAFGDPRFPKLEAEELRDVEIEISVLSPMREIKDVSEIVPGKHGILMSRGFRSGVLLPQVASERGWDRETFLRNTCRKAGMDENCWQKPGTSISIFEAEVFSENNFS